MTPKRKVLIVSILISLTVIGLGFFGLTAKTEAANCGGGTVCACGDIVIASTTLTGNVNCAGHGLIVGASNITIDGNGYTLTGDGGVFDYGIYNSAGRDGITVKNFANITNFKRGIFFLNSTNSKFINNAVSSSTDSGIYLSNSAFGTLTGNRTSSNKHGIYLAASPSSALTGNTTDSNITYGVYLLNSGSSTLTGNTTKLNRFGVYVDTSNSVVLNGNTANSNTIGFYFVFSSLNTITNNIISNNTKDIYGDNTAIYSSNQFLHNGSSTMLSFVEIPRIKNVNDAISFSAAMFTPTAAACSSCSARITMHPAEAVISAQNSNILTGTSTLTKSGLYSLNFVVTDGNGNTTKRNYRFFVGATDTTTTRYYYRQKNTTHGQPRSTPPSSDGEALLLTAPIGTESGHCSDWVQNSIDELPNYPLAILSEVNANVWHMNELDGYIGVQRFVSYSMGVDTSSPVAAAADYTLAADQNFADLEWSLDYLHNWHWLALKLTSTPTGNPSWQSTPSQPSYADFTYTYTTTPSIKSISNENVDILSATAPANATSAVTIILDNLSSSATSTVLTLAGFNRPFLNTTSNLNSNGAAEITTSNLTANATTSISAVAMDLIPSAGSINVVIDAWNTTGNYYRKWTETSSDSGITAIHTIGDLLANSKYDVKVDGITFGSYRANGSGIISFTYNGGYSSAKIFEVRIAPAGATITESNGGTNVAESGAVDSYTIILDTPPTADVLITVNPDSQLAVFPVSSIFTSSTWSGERTVVVTAVDDSVYEKGHHGVITHSVSSADPNYNGVLIAGITAQITDNDPGNGGILSMEAYWFPESPRGNFGILIKNDPREKEL